MNIQAEVDENGIIKISDPSLWGKKVTLSIFENNGNEPSNDSKPESSNDEDEEWPEPSELVKGAEKTDWDAFRAIAREADQLDFPRRTHEEIIRDIHDIRG